ncbi:hypothetical protein ADN00_14680 [Ornatilinea apprima]|uniref:Uncharacterized protein n=1 Tax=Ornatilinea apprima TaxID=1134406 RepID=A0A0P6XFH9_9CHLR|nr:hypothetical protein [Ornatilinea apprima]KPL73582.1 hypothetical protein ADN00_14680 [Ornatilinea apprima]
MKPNTWRTILGVILVVLGAVSMAQIMGVFPEGSMFMTSIIALAFLGGGAAFLAVFLGNRANWWALIPGVILADLGLLIGFSEFVPGFDVISGAFFMAGLSLAFWLVYIFAPQNWWAIIPGGVLLTLAAIILLSDITDSDGFFVPAVLFLGMAATFAALALLRGHDAPVRWAWIPAGVLGVMGAMMALSATSLVGYVWPAALVLGGLYLIIRPTLRKQ